MLQRRGFGVLLFSGALSAGSARAQGVGFQQFLAGVRAEARRAGVSDATLDRALSGIHENLKVVELDRRQPEFTLTWAQYRAKVVDPKIANGRTAYAQQRGLLDRVDGRFGVQPDVVMGIWGLESAYGQITGNYNVIEALATLAYEGRRAAFFRGHLITALKILDAGDIVPAKMLGSYAGAMGQPQFMPDSYMRLAVDFDGDGRRDIWTSLPDVFGSIANYLQKSGWRSGEPWGQPVRVTGGIDAGNTGRDLKKSLGEWERMGVRRIDGAPFSRKDVIGAVLLPDGPAGDAFMVYHNFSAIRRYNPSDFYAIAVGLLGDAVVG